MKARLLVAAALLLAACGQVPHLTAGSIPAGLVPARLGDLTFHRQPTAELAFAKAGPTSLAAQGQVYTVQYGHVVAASFQVVLYKPDVDVHDPRVLYGIGRTIGEGVFDERKVHGQTIEVMHLDQQTIYLWFPRKLNVHCLLVVTRKFKAADKLMRAIIEFQQGRVPVAVPVPSPVVVLVYPSPAPTATGVKP